MHKPAGGLLGLKPLDDLLKRRHVVSRAFVEDFHHEGRVNGRRTGKQATVVAQFDKESFRFGGKQHQSGKKAASFKTLSALGVSLWK
jgi:hypothetical protein